MTFIYEVSTAHNELNDAARNAVLFQVTGISSTGLFTGIINIKYGPLLIHGRHLIWKFILKPTNHTILYVLKTIILLAVK